MKKTVFILFMAFMLIAAGCSSNSGNSGSQGSTQQPDTTNNTGGQEQQQEQQQPKTNFPEKPIELVVGYAPGGSNDTTARIFATALSKILPQEVVVVNKPGGASTIAMTDVYNSKPDGYTIAIATNTALTISPHTTDVGYEWDNFTNILRLVAIPQVLHVAKDAPWNSFEEWLEYVKANPGKYQYSDSGTGSIAHLAMEELNVKAGIQTVHVPYQGSGPAYQALLGGHVQGMVAFAGTGDPEQSRILVSFSEERSKLFDAPTLREKGIDAGITAWIGIVAAPGMDPEVEKVIHDAFKQAMEDPEVVEQLEQQGLEPYYADSEQFTKVIEEGYGKYEEILKGIGLIE